MWPELSVAWTSRFFLWLYSRHNMGILSKRAWRFRFGGSTNPGIVSNEMSMNFGHFRNDYEHPRPHLLEHPRQTFFDATGCNFFIWIIWSWSCCLAKLLGIGTMNDSLKNWEPWTEIIDFRRLIWVVPSTLPVAISLQMRWKKQNYNTKHISNIHSIYIPPSNIINDLHGKLSPNPDRPSKTRRVPIPSPMSHQGWVNSLGRKPGWEDVKRVCFLYILISLYITDITDILSWEDSGETWTLSFWVGWSLVESTKQVWVVFWKNG